MSIIHFNILPLPRYHLCWSLKALLEAQWIEPSISADLTLSLLPVVIEDSLVPTYLCLVPPDPAESQDQREPLMCTGCHRTEDMPGRKSRGLLRLGHGCIFKVAELHNPSGAMAYVGHPRTRASGGSDWLWSLCPTQPITGLTARNKALQSYNKTACKIRTKEWKMSKWFIEPRSSSLIFETIPCSSGPHWILLDSFRTWRKEYCSKKVVSYFRTEPQKVQISTPCWVKALSAHGQFDSRESSKTPMRCGHNCVCMALVHRKCVCKHTMSML